MLQADAATTHALVVGIETYGEVSADLDGPTKNAIAFADWLISRGVPPEHVRLHVAPAAHNTELRTETPVERREATEEALRGALRSLQEIEASFLFVYWSGHAFELNSRLRMLVADSHPKEVRNFDLDSLLHALRTSNFSRIGHQAILIDTCRLPVAPDQQLRFREGEVPPGAAKRPYRQLVLLSAQPNQPAANIGGAGVFSGRLLAELRAEPVGVWPPDLEGIAERLNPADADAETLPPALWRFRGWLDERDESEILSPGPSLWRGTRGLTAERRRRLVELLADMPEMRNPEGREAVLLRLHRGPELRSLIEELPGADGAVETIVAICERWPDGIMDLVGAVRTGDPASPAAEALEHAFPAGSLTYAQLDALWPLLFQVDLWGDHLQQLYRNSLPRHAALHSEARTASSVVRVLADMTRQEGSFPYPALEFVERVAAYVGETALASGLRAWVDRNGAELDLEQDAILAMRRSVLHLPEAQGASGYLQIALRRGAYAPDTFLARGWYCPDATTALPVLDREISAVDSPERCLSDVLRELARDPHCSCRDLHLEFFLESDMLFHPVEDWQVQPAGRIRIPAGVKYSCVLRSMERAESPEQREEWSDKWTALLSRFGAAAGEVLSPVRADDCRDPEALYLRLTGDAVIGAFLPFRPQARVSDEPTVLDAVLDAGLPIAMWLKTEPEDTAAADASLRQFLGGHAVGELRGVVQEHRKRARLGDDARCFGHQIVLLWDDPSRPLPTNRLRQPST